MVWGRLGAAPPVPLGGGRAPAGPGHFFMVVYVSFIPPPPPAVFKVYYNSDGWWLVELLYWGISALASVKPERHLQQGHVQ
jgi:hypothetical protein